MIKRLGSRIRPVGFDMLTETYKLAALNPSVYKENFCICWLIQFNYHNKCKYFNELFSDEIF